MRKLTTRDLLATLIIAAVVVPFVGYSARGSMHFVQDPRGSQFPPRRASVRRGGRGATWG